MKPHCYPLSAFAVLSLLSMSGCNQTVASDVSKSNTKPLKPVQVIELPDQSQNKRHQFTGKLKSSQSAAIAFRVPGLIEEILVHPGDYVKKGQLLAYLDPHDYEVSKSELEARLAEAKAAHKLAKTELMRVKKAVSDDAISSVTLDRAQSGYDRSKAMVEVVKRNIQKADDAIRYTRLKAPFSGVIGTSNFDKFEQVTPGLSVFTLHRPDKLEVDIDVPENLIDKLYYATDATVFWHDAPHALKAYQTEMETRPDPIKQTYTVTYEIDSTSLTGTKLLPGKSVTLATNFAEQGANYCIPYSAIVGRDNQHYVFKVKETKEHNVNQVGKQGVEVVSLQTDQACIKGELKSRDLIVVSGAHYLSDGETVGEIQLRSDKG